MLLLPNSFLEREGKGGPACVRARTRQSQRNPNPSTPTQPNPPNPPILLPPQVVATKAKERSMKTSDWEKDKRAHALPK